jgi:hypothetical protein
MTRVWGLAAPLSPPENALNWYPAFGLADIDTGVPAANHPPEVIDPPFAGSTEVANKYCVSKSAV